MILEHALLQVRPARSEEFEESMREARELIVRQPGFQSIQVRASEERDDLYLLLVEWDDVASHRDGFRKSDDYQRWRALLHNFYDPMPQVEYFGADIFDD